MLLALSLKGVRLKVRERHQEPWEVQEISKETVGKGCSQVAGLFHYAWQEKAAQRLKEELMGLGE